jgi:septation ring formation regulator EzrA
MTKEEKQIQKQKETELKELSATIQNIINREVADKLNSTITNNYKDAYKDAISVIEEHINNYKESIEDFTETNLTVNMIESEGGLRALLTVLNQIKYHEKYYFKGDK